MPETTALVLVQKSQDVGEGELGCYLQPDFDEQGRECWDCCVLEHGATKPWYVFRVAENDEGKLYLIKYEGLPERLFHLHPGTTVIGEG